MRWFFLLYFLLVIATVYAIKPRGDSFSSPPLEIFSDMDDQFKQKFQKPNSFFDNNQGSRKPVEGTVPLGYVYPSSKSISQNNDLNFSIGNNYYNTGKENGKYGKGYPKELNLLKDKKLLELGKNKFNIMCSTCHGASGKGSGIISEYWKLPPTANLLDKRVVELPEGQIFWTISNGKGLMGPYKGTLSVKDRWAIVAYLRQIQKSQNK